MGRSFIRTALELARTLPSPTALRMGTLGTPKVIMLMGTDTRRNEVTRRREHRTLPLRLTHVRRRAANLPYTRIRTEFLGSIVAGLINRTSASSQLQPLIKRNLTCICRLGQKGCIACRNADKSVRSNFCRACEVSVTQNAPAIIEIAEDNETFKSGAFALSPASHPGRLRFWAVAKQFRDSWRRTTACPQVRAVYKVVSTQQSIDEYNSYRYVSIFPYPKCELTTPNFSNSVEARGHFTKVNRQPGNVNRRWHGTRKKCSLGDKGCTTFCSDTQCALCCIIKTSFDVKKASKGQFGTGIYTSSTSSKFASACPSTDTLH